MLQLLYDDYLITIVDDPTYTSGSRDNVHTYEHEYVLGHQQYSPTSRHSVRVSHGGLDVASCILSEERGATGCHQNSALIHGDRCQIAVGSHLVSLRLPQLELLWDVQVDDATCFGVYHSPKHEFYVSHGELTIAAVSYVGQIAWCYYGPDIFVVSGDSSHGGRSDEMADSDVADTGFCLHDDHVEVMDWDGRIHRIELATGQGVILHEY